MAAGTYSLDYQVTDSSSPQGAEDADFTVTVLASRPTPLALPNIPDQTFRRSALPQTVTLPAASGGAGNYSYSISSVDEGVDVLLNGNTRVLTVRDMAPGTYTINYRAIDADDSRLVKSFIITIQEDLALPDIPQIEARKGRPVQDVTLPAATGGSASTVYSVADLVTGITFNAAERRLRIDADKAARGEHVITYTATDGTATASESLRIVILPTLALAVDNPQAVRDKPLAPGDVPGPSVLLSDIFDVITECGVGEESGVITPLSPCGTKVAKLLTTETGVRFDQATQTLYINNDTFNSGNGGEILLEFECVEDE